MIHDFNERFELLKKYFSQNSRYITGARSEITNETKQKADGSPVTSADQWGNDYWEDIIKTEFPGEVFIGEESDSHSYPKDAEYVWYVDPIDGTKEYISGYGPYYTLIGLAVNGLPAFGIVQEPETGKIIYGSTEQQPILLNGRHDQHQTLGGIRSWEKTNRVMMRGINAEKRKNLKERLNVDRVRNVGVTHNQLGPLFNKCSGFISNRATSYWDICGPAAIMSAAGFDTEFKVGENKVRLNDGSIMADRFYILPQDAPEEVKKAVMDW
ncbi:MAG: inositol monophosphatase family protein [Balneolales bacterium]